MTSLPDWFKKSFPVTVIPRRDFYVCTHCHSQSCGALYSSICIKCADITSNPPHTIRPGYVCADCITGCPVCLCGRALPRVHIPSPYPFYRSPAASTSRRFYSTAKQGCCSSCCKFLCESLRGCLCFRQE
ncbi:unnamed protein product [Rotaria sp. Silwood1]|nr:unnamed protein product [Rotaria sp. Silwood1]